MAWLLSVLNAFFLRRKLKLEENIANIWPGFGNNRKDLIKVLFIAEIGMILFYYQLSIYVL